MLIEDLVIANHVLAAHGVVDGYGHVSARSERDPNRYFLSRSLAPALVTADDIMEFDLDSNPINSGNRTPYLETFIHGEIYKVRRDVKAIVHNHAPELIPFGATTTPLRAIYHMAYFIQEQVPIFEIRDSNDGKAGLLVDTRQRGEALATTLGNNTVALMRGHGSVVVASSIGDAVARCVYVVLNARAQAQATALGGTIAYLNASELQAMTDIMKDGFVRAWNLWKRTTPRP
jgi:HCOMODA/2-hydroxy-3-carboxy-muconic semialdehyde decarboxylase